MEINANLINRIEDAEKLGANEEQIKELLLLPALPSEIKQQYATMQQYYTVRETAEVLKPQLGDLKNDRAYELKVLRLIKEGKLAALKGKNNRESFRIKKDEVKRFIEDSKKTKEEWKALAEQQAKTIEKLEKEIAELKAAVEKPAPKKKATARAKTTE